MRRWLPLLVLCAPGCFTAGYLQQAAAGQYELLHVGRPISSVVEDPKTPPRVKRLLAEVDAVKAFGRAQGLTPTKNYQRYSELHRDAAVWVVQACAPLKFEVKRWSFPLVGTVPYLGFFSPAPAHQLAARLEREEGLDVSVRTAAAYSTLGWFRDPVLSTMLAEGDGAAGALANTILHESVHATVYVASQSSFDESLASFIADRLTPGFLAQRYGFFSPEVQGWFAGEREWKQRTARLHRAYVELDALYRSGRSDGEKRAEKQRLLAALQAELRLKRPLNNASLAGYQTYAAGDEGFARLFDACGGAAGMLRAVATLKPANFEQPQQEQFDGLLDALAARACRKPR